MNIKEQYKGKVITHKDGILGMIKFNLDEITPMQERRLRALGYTHLFEDSVVKNDESHEPTDKEIESIKTTAVEAIIDIYANGMKEAIESQKTPVKRTRKKKAQ